MDLRQAVQILGIPENASASQALRAMKELTQNASSPQQRRRALEAFNVWQGNQTHEKRAKPTPFFGVPAIFTGNDKQDKKSEGSKAVSTKTRNRFKDAFKEGVGTGKAKEEASALAKALLFKKGRTTILRSAMAGILISIPMLGIGYGFGWGLADPPREYTEWEQAWSPIAERCHKLVRNSHTSSLYLLRPRMMDGKIVWDQRGSDIEYPPFPTNVNIQRYNEKMDVVTIRSWEELWNNDHYYDAKLADGTSSKGNPDYVFDRSKVTACAYAGQLIDHRHTLFRIYWHERRQVIEAILLFSLLISVIYAAFKTFKLKREYDDFVSEISK